MLLRFGRSVRRFGQGCFFAKTGPRASRKYVRRWRGPRARRKSFRVGCPCPRLGSGEAWSSPSNRLIPDLIAPIRPLQLYADGDYQLRIRSLEGTTNYGPWQHAATFTRRLRDPPVSERRQVCMYAENRDWHTHSYISKWVTNQYLDFFSIHPE
jgi:hypothetical protein